MPAIDNCEPQAVRAIKKSGWEVTHQPFFVRFSREESVYADVRFKHRIEKRQIIVVEIKCFPEKRSELDEFYHAAGQYILYRNLLALKGIKSPLYLVVPLRAYNSFFQRRTIQAAINDAKIKLIVVDMEKEEVVTWLD